MGIVWVNSTANTVPTVSYGPPVPAVVLWILLLVIMLAGTYALVYIIAKAWIAYHEWIAGLVAEKVVEKMKEEQEG
ncbi:hypothetical protein [Geoglobus ahangari]